MPLYKSWCVLQWNTYSEQQKEQTIDTLDNMDESQMHYAK